MSKNLTIAVAAEDTLGLEGDVGMHFGRCPAFVVVQTEDNRIKEANVKENPSFANHQPGVVPEFVNSLGANVIIAGGMGPKAINMFHSFGIDVATGVGGKVGNVVNAFLEGKVSGIIPCNHDHTDSCGSH
ncbi:MAG: NifB/NifX family molybdenum-iron cluster-binding protein [Deltaproteobacteria bacterium]|nr:NifB/NifX family molybdenum-iron cluster-binding protein [Deltaproteobacteria bacterium]